MSKEQHSQREDGDFVSTLAGEPTFAVGSIVGVHGLAGLVKVRPVTNKPEILLDLSCVRSKATRTLASLDLEIEELEFDKRMLRMSFAGYPDRTSVEVLVGAELFAWPCEVRSLGEEEFWVKDLVGVEVFTLDGNLVGKVIAIVHGGGDLLEVVRDGDTSGKTILVPFVRDIVPVVDLSARRIEVVDIPGLLEPQ